MVCSLCFWNLREIQTNLALVACIPDETVYSKSQTVLLAARNHREPGWLVFIVQLLVFLDLYSLRSPLNILAVFKPKLTMVCSAPTVEFMLDINNLDLA